MSLTNRDQSASHSLRLYARLLGYLRPHKVAFVFSILGYLLFASTNVAAAKWLGWTIDAIERNDIEWRLISPILCVLIALFRGIGGFMGGYSIAHIANHLIHKLRCEVMMQILNLPLGFFDQKEPGKLVSKVTYDVNQITGAVTTAITVILREGLTVVSLLIALFIVDWKLSLTFLVIMPIVAKIVTLASKKFRKYSSQMQDSMGEVTHIVSESIRGRSVIRAFGAADKIAQNFEKASKNNRIQNMKMAVTEAISTPIIQLMVSIAIAILVWFSMAPEQLTDRSSGEFVAFLTMASLLAKPIRQLSQVNSIIQRGLAASESIFEILDQPVEINSGQLLVERIRGHVEFRNIGLNYSEEKVTLREVNLEIESGEIVALVGMSGSGKTSLANLIPRFYSRTSGDLLIDGVSIDDFDLSCLRQQISIVDQNVVLFSGSIAENIAYGEGTEFSMEKVQRAAENAYVTEFTDSLPGGLDSPVGNDAALLSGGQRQRIAIARALYKNAPILILDEATSALDSHSEQQIQKAVQNLMHGRTTIVIAHRLSTIENADLIVVMSEGKIVEKGSHKQLISLKGHYEKLYNSEVKKKIDS